MLSPRILVVEDEAIVAADILDLLKRQGYRTTCLPTAEEALRKLSEINPDLIVMNIRLRGKIDGLQAPLEIRRPQAIPGGFLTANDSDPRLRSTDLAEPFVCIKKPFDERELRATIESALSDHQELWPEKMRH